MQKKYHKMVSEAAESFLTAKPVDIQINEFASKTIKTNRKVLCSVISCIVFSGTHALPLRGKESSGGVFQDLCNFRIDVGDKILQEHFKHGAKNGSYKSVRIQNEIIDMCGRVMRKEIFEIVKKANYCAILADETVGLSSKKQLLIGLRYFDEEEEEIREEFTGFVQPDALNAQSIAKAIGDFLINHEADPLKCVAFGFDGCSTVSGKEGEIQAILRLVKIDTFVDAVCFLWFLELGFRGHDETSTSANRGNYMDLISLISKYDPCFKTDLEQSSVFQGTSKRIKNDLIFAIWTVVSNKIIDEIKQTRFNAIIVDETTDVTNFSQLSAIVRFVNKDGIVQERFLGFINVSEDRTADALYKIVCELLKSINDNNKLIAQSYDGVAVMAGHLGSLQLKVRETYPSAIFIHWFAHKLNLFLSQSVMQIKECKVFFATLS
ncbi:unnamed protein product [Diabrotica balteata]|uniref:DUF4371 domain-containing protein n=1 Tax=Diabrotica balteata TaxID=107213 RepID=A0A9N9SZV7_DIABA|nr:unnamed protein product [Diabrotica balteata]